MSDLRGLAELALKLVRSSLQRTKSGDPVFVLGWPDGEIKRLPFPAEYGDLMNNGEAKDIIFGAVREIAQRSGADKVVFASESWRGKLTEAAKGLPKEEVLRLSCEKGFQTAVDLGFIEREEAIFASAQNASTLMTVWQSFRRLSDGTVYSYGDVEVMEIPQEQFAGRAKMFGDLSEDNLR